MDHTSLVAFLVDWITEAEVDTAACPEEQVATLELIRMAPGPIVWHRRDMQWASIPFAIEVTGTVLPFFGECGAFEGEAQAAVIQAYYTPAGGIPYMPSDKRPDTFLAIRVVIVSNECTLHSPRQSERLIVRHPADPASPRTAGKPASALKLPRRLPKQSDVEKAFR